MIATVLLTSCGSEYHYANAFLRKHRRGTAQATERVVVCLPSQVLHTCSSLNDVTDFEQYSATQQDSLLTVHARLLPAIDDSVFMAQFAKAMLYVIGRTRMPVTVLHDESLLPRADSQTFVINVVQLEAEEFLENTRSDFYTRRGVYYAYDYPLRHFSTNAWFEFDAPDTANDMYFKNCEVSDDFQGCVTAIRDQRAQLEGTFTRITPADAYETARVLGFTCGRLYVERLLHQVVKQRQGSNQWYFYYDDTDDRIHTMVLDYDAINDAEGFQKIERR